MESKNVDQLLLVTKLTIPPIYRDKIMARLRLCGQLATSTLHPLMLVSAPAGLGKITLIAEWFRQQELLVAQISLERADNKLIRNQLMGLSLTDQQVEDLCQGAEGWIVSIQLAPFSLTGLEDMSNAQHFINTFTGTNIEQRAIGAEFAPLVPLQEQEAPLIERLSEREYSVLRLVSEGLSNQQIARSLVVTVSTVKTHLNNIYAKFHVHTRLQAVTKAYDLGLLSPWLCNSSETENVPFN